MIIYKIFVKYTSLFILSAYFFVYLIDVLGVQWVQVHSGCMLTSMHLIFEALKDPVKTHDSNIF